MTKSYDTCTTSVKRHTRFTRPRRLGISRPFGTCPTWPESACSEIGCGRGIFAHALAERGADLTAADVSEAAIRHAAIRLEDVGVTPIVADVQAIPFADETFDVVVSQRR